VLNGRGVNIAQHPGNQRFRSFIKTRYDATYCATFSTDQKKALAQEVYNHIKSLDPPGRFLKRDGTQSSRGLEGPWEELDETEAKKKAGQALRDCNRLDRTGYAAQIKAPPDVEQSAEERKLSGLSLKDHAVALDEKSKQPKRGNKNKRSSSNRKKPPPVAAAASRKNTKRTSRESSRVNGCKKQRLEEPIPAFSQTEFPQDESRAAAPVLSSYPGFASATVTSNDTPVPTSGVSVPVTQTPGAHRFALNTYDYPHPTYPPQHHHHHDGSYQYLGSPHPPNMPPSSPSYGLGDATRDQFTAEDANSVDIVAHPAPYSPILRSNPPQDGIGHSENAPRLPSEEPLYGQNLFDDGDDAFHSMAANAAAGIPPENHEDDFDLMQPHNHDHDGNQHNLWPGLA